MTITLVVTASILLFVSLYLGERNAWKRRSQRVESRGTVPRELWYQDLPELRPNTIDRALDAIAAVLHVDSHTIRPDDCLHSDLSVIDGFFCIVEDDDTIECLCDKIEDELGSRPAATWSTLRDVVNEFASMSRVAKIEQNQRIHAESSRGSWAMVAQPLGPGGPGRSAIEGYDPRNCYDGP